MDSLDYELVLQVQNVDSGDFDRLLRWEKGLVECLGASAEIDGHDLGSGEFNVFIFTDNPEATFRATQVAKRTRQRLGQRLLLTATEIATFMSFSGPRGKSSSTSPSPWKRNHKRGTCTICGKVLFGDNPLAIERSCVKL